MRQTLIWRSVIGREERLTAIPVVLARHLVIDRPVRLGPVNTREVAGNLVRAVLPRCQDIRSQPRRRSKGTEAQKTESCSLWNIKSTLVIGVKMSSSQTNTACVLRPGIGLKRLLRVSLVCLTILTRPWLTRAFSSGETCASAECHVMKTVWTLYPPVPDQYPRFGPRVGSAARTARSRDSAG